MRLTCRDCEADFILAPEKISPQGLSSKCPFCQAGFELLPADEEGHQRVVFHGKRIRLRTCIHCSKEFPSPREEVIPVCPRCQDIHSAPEVDAAPKRWKVEKDGQVIEHESEAAVREWVRHGMISPNDPVISPSGARMPAKRAQQLRSAFQDQNRKRLQPPSFAFGRRIFRQLFAATGTLKWIVIGIVSIMLGWTTYRVITLPPPPPPTDPAIERLVARLRDRVKPPNRPVPVLVETARRFMSQDRREDYDQARRILEQALLADSNSPDVIGGLAIVYGIVSRFGDDPSVRISAMELADLAIRLYPERPEGYLAKARAALGAQSLDVARESSGKALEVSNRNPDALLTHAALLLAKGKTAEELEQAITVATNAVQDNPNLMESYSIIARAHIGLGEPEKALSAYEKRLSHAANDSVSPYGIGVLEQRAQNYGTAKEWFQQALRQSPRNVAARLSLALIYHRIEKKRTLAERHLRDILSRYRRFSTPEEIFDAQRELIAIFSKTERVAGIEEIAGKFPPLLIPSPKLLITKAWVAELQGQTQEAIEKARETVTTFPSDARANFFLAQLLEKHSTAEEAVRAYRALIELEPTWLLPYLYLVRLFVQTDRSEESLDVANSAVTRAGIVPENDLWVPLEERLEPPPWKSFLKRFGSLASWSDSTAFPHALIGLVHLQQGLTENAPSKTRAALQAFRKARLLDRDQAYASIYVGQAHYYLKQWKDAEKMFQAALKIDPVNVSAHYWLGSTLRHKKEKGQAELNLKTVMENKKWGFRGRGELGHLALDLGKSEEAFEYWHAALRDEIRYLPAWQALLSSSRP